MRARYDVERHRRVQKPLEDLLRDLAHRMRMPSGKAPEWLVLRLQSALLEAHELGEEFGEDTGEYPLQLG